MNRSFALAALIALIAGAASAQSPGGPVRQACAADIAQLCANTPTGHGEVMKCLRSQKASLSPQCRDAMASAKAARKTAAAQGASGQPPMAPQAPAPAPH